MVVLGLLAAACAGRGPSEGTPTPPKSFVVFFEGDHAELSPEANLVIERVAAEAKRIQATGVGIAGYSSPAGNQAVNLKLSEERSAAVEGALIARGVPKDIIVRTYHGATEVVGSGVEGRRVEIVVTREARRR
jgi:outer membrane protein OmpA-like peptidoglycan-associated protein